VFGLVAVLGGLFAHTAASSTDPETIVQAQLAAYNARDLSAFLATYAEDAQLFEHPSKLLASGVAQMRERYAARFADPTLHAVVVKRIVMGNYVIDHETVTRTFAEGTGTQDAIAMYEIQGTLIARVWFVFGAKTLDPKP
jgi:putative hydrolase of HD superfamily